MDDSKPFSFGGGSQERTRTSIDRETIPSSSDYTEVEPEDSNIEGRSDHSSENNMESANGRSGIAMSDATSIKSEAGESPEGISGDSSSEGSPVESKANLAETLLQKFNYRMSTGFLISESPSEKVSDESSEADSQLLDSETENPPFGGSHLYPLEDGSLELDSAEESRIPHSSLSENAAPSEMPSVTPIDLKVDAARSVFRGEAGMEGVADSSIRDVRESAPDARPSFGRVNEGDSSVQREREGAAASNVLKAADGNGRALVEDASGPRPRDVGSVRTEDELSRSSVGIAEKQSRGANNLASNRSELVGSELRGSLAKENAPPLTEVKPRPIAESGSAELARGLGQAGASSESVEENIRSAHSGSGERLQREGSPSDARSVETASLNRAGRTETKNVDQPEESLSRQAKDRVSIGSAINGIGATREGRGDHARPSVEHFANGARNVEQGQHLSGPSDSVRQAGATTSQSAVEILPVQAQSLQQQGPQPQLGISGSNLSAESALAEVKSVASGMGQNNRGEEREEKRQSKRDQAMEVALGARSSQSSSAVNTARSLPGDVAVSTIMQRVIDSIDQITRAAQHNRVRLSVELESGERVQVALRVSKNSVKTVFLTDSEGLRVAIRESWEQFQKQIASRGLDAQLPDFGSSSSGQQRENGFESELDDEFYLSKGFENDGATDAVQEEGSVELASQIESIDSGDDSALRRFA